VIFSAAIETVTEVLWMQVLLFFNPSEAIEIAGIAVVSARPSSNLDCQ